MTGDGGWSQVMVGGPIATWGTTRRHTAATDCETRSTARPCAWWVGHGRCCSTTGLISSRARCTGSQRPETHRQRSSIFIIQHVTELFRQLDNYSSTPNLPTSHNSGVTISSLSNAVIAKPVGMQDWVDLCYMKVDRLTTPQNCPFPLQIRTPSNNSFLGPPDSAHKRHTDRFSRKPFLQGSRMWPTGRQTTTAHRLQQQAAIAS